MPTGIGICSILIATIGSKLSNDLADIRVTSMIVLLRSRMSWKLSRPVLKTSNVGDAVT